MKSGSMTWDLNQEIAVRFSYPVCFTRGVFKPDNPVLLEAIRRLEPDRRHRMVFFIESKVAGCHPGLPDDISAYLKAYPDSLELASYPVLLDGGEDAKGFGHIANICRIIAEAGLCRQSVVVIIGGGAFIDTVGLAASLFHRGVRQVRMPTTTLAQDDSGVGVKNGVNMFGQKNMVGVFAPPFAVVNDFDFLDTLDQRDWISGAAEAFKVALIKDAGFFHWLVGSAAAIRDRDKAVMELLIRRCAEIHLEHIRDNGDPFEFGSARPLDFGHWAAHKLELMSEGAIRHGEAVAIGLALDSVYAWRRGMLEEKHFTALLAALESIGFELWSDLLTRGERGRLIVLDGIREFREHLGGDLKITLPDGLGEKIEVDSLDESGIVEAIDFLECRGKLSRA